MNALPGERYCLTHQGNHSHYDVVNCTVCKLSAENAQLKNVIDNLERRVDALESDIIETAEYWQMDNPL